MRCDHIIWLKKNFFWIFKIYHPMHATTTVLMVSLGYSLIFVKLICIIRIYFFKSLLYLFWFLYAIGLLTMWKCTIRTHNVHKVLKLFPAAVEKLRIKLDDALEQLNEMLPLMKSYHLPPFIPLRKNFFNTNRKIFEGDHLRNALRIDAKEKQYKKQYNDAFNGLKLATRICCEIFIIRVGVPLYFVSILDMHS